MDSADVSTIQKPLIQHVQELRAHLTWMAIFVTAGGLIGYFLQDRLLTLLQKPLNQTLYYSSPTGGIAFLFKLCITTGIIFALPAILYNTFRFVEPVLEKDQRKGLVKYIVWSFMLAYAGVAFAYFVSLPAALHFLSGFGGDKVKALIGANEYFNFAIAYVGGFAFLFQLPLIILFINRIKPLKPSKMMKAQRWVILISFIVAAVLTPTPDPFNQTIMAVPMIILYQFGVFLVMMTNRKRARVAKRQARLARILDQSVEPSFADQFDEAFDDLLDEDFAASPLPKPVTINHVTHLVPPIKRAPVVQPVQRGRVITDIGAPTKLPARRPIPQLRERPLERPAAPATARRLMIGNDFSNV
ncbi:MAG: Sec-independent protein translocase subunit TatC, sec-independent protein translocase protein TatC [Candidatus Saccharibacteria bacterium]|nr:Sec-independent protein translocase subunit TatC, sec-independent protein translocase protein TatC [Candidatus Saccharibacteria bacterium]